MKNLHENECQPAVPSHRAEPARAAATSSPPSLSSTPVCRFAPSSLAAQHTPCGFLDLAGPSGSLGWFQTSQLLLPAPEPSVSPLCALPVTLGPLPPSPHPELDQTATALPAFTHPWRLGLFSTPTNPSASLTSGGRPHLHVCSGPQVQTPPCCLCSPHTFI